MLCERCGQRPASVSIVTTDNDSVSKLNLCHVCADEMGASVVMNEFFVKFLDSFFESAHQVSQEPQLKCPVCLMTYEGFKATGKLGCANCYNAFKPLLTPILKQLHGDVKHRGKLPKSARAKASLKMREEELKALLDRAVKAEEYEEAARLRDELRAMKGAIGNE